MEDLVIVARKRLAAKKFPEEVIDRLLTPERVERLVAADIASDRYETLFAVLDEIWGEREKEAQAGYIEQLLAAASTMGLPVDRIKETCGRLLGWQQSHKDVPLSEQIRAFMDFATTGKDESGFDVADVLKGIPFLGCTCDFDEPLLLPEAERITIEVAIPDSHGLGVLEDEHIGRLFYYGEDNPPRSGCHWRGTRPALAMPGSVPGPRPTDPAFRTSELPGAVIDTVLELLKGVTCDLATEIQSRLQAGTPYLGDDVAPEFLGDDSALATYAPSLGDKDPPTAPK